MSTNTTILMAMGAAALALASVRCDATGSDSSDGGHGGTGTAHPQGGSGGNIFDPDSGPPCETHCSWDLHAVVDCNDAVVTQCPSDQGCNPQGGCVPACEAAALNASTFGCDFFSVTPATIAEARGGCFAVMIANTWTTGITIGAEYGGQTIDAMAHTYVPVGSGTGLTYQLAGAELAPGQLGLLFLSKYESGDVYQVDCPAGVTQALELPTQLDATGVGSAFHITTSAPTVAYDVYPWGGAASYVSSATLLVPTPTWGTNFVTADAWQASAGYPFTQIVASQDATTVTMVPVANVQGGGELPAMTANAPTSFTLNRGQVAQFIQAERLAGSTLQADKPISVWGGASCMNIPVALGACDGAHQQLVPVQMLGNQYVGARYPSRGGDDSAPYTLVGMVEGTTLSYDPQPSANAPATIGRGQVVSFWTEQPFVVTSQDGDHPFYLSAHMTGAQTDTAAPDSMGDPEWVNLVPPQQYLAYYLFATDPTYGNTALVFIRQKGSDQLFHDVHLDCLDPVTGWVPVGAGGAFEVARVMIVEQGQGVGGCNSGVHTASSDVPFGLWVWGYDWCSSYSYPAGMSVEPINTIVIPPVPN